MATDFTSRDYWIPFCWGFVVLASWLGWGELVRLALGQAGKRAGWGLRAAWGMAAVLTIGGVLQAFAACTLTALLVVTLAGASVWLLSAYAALRRHRGAGLPRAARWKWVWLAWAPVTGLLTYCYMVSVIAFDLNWWDDLLAYLVFAQKYLQTGHVMEPYALRRLVTYGGQQMLDATLLIGGTFINVDILELGLGRILFAGMVVELIPRGNRRAWIIAAAVALVFLLSPRGMEPSLNTNSEMTGAVLFMAITRTFQLARGRRDTGRMALAVAMMAAAVATMRANFVAAAGFSILLCYAARILLERRQWKRHAGHLAAALAAFIAILLPWALGMYRSSGTLLYPLWPGNQRPENSYYDAGLTHAETLWRVVGFFAYPLGLSLAAPMLLAVYRKYWWTEGPMVLAALAAIIATLVGYTLTTYDHIYRYVFPMMFAISAVLAVRSNIRARTLVERTWAVAAVVLIAAVQVWPGAVWLFGERSKVLTREKESPLMYLFSSVDAYREAQRKVPERAVIFEATSYPTLLDYGRNTIYIADVPGAASPPPGMPIFKGGAALRDYLIGQGVEYVIFTVAESDFTQYSKAYWNDVVAHPENYEQEKSHSAPYNLAFIKSLEELEQAATVVHSTRTLRVVRLK